MARYLGVRIWVKRQVHLEHLNFNERNMVAIASTGLLSFFRRLAQSKGPDDAPAKPLTKRYAIYKSKRGKGNRRNLFFTGQLLGSVSIRTVSENAARIAPLNRMRAENRLQRSKEKKAGQIFTGRFTNKDVGWANQKREPWMVWSLENVRVLYGKAQEILFSLKDMIIRTKAA